MAVIKKNHALKNFFYYIKYDDFNEYRHKITLESINDFEVTNKIINNYIQKENYVNAYLKDPKEPFIITNDIRLYAKYQFVFSECQFEKFCKKELELDGNDAFKHFREIASGIYTKAEMVHGVTTDNYQDEYGTSGVGEKFYDEGWKKSTDINNWEYETIVYPNSKGYITFNENDIPLEDNHFSWWSNLDCFWKKLLIKQSGSEGVYSGIPTKEGLRKIININKLEVKTKRDYNGIPDSSNTYLESLNSNDFDFIGILQNLKTLDIIGLELTDVNFLKNNTNIKELNISGNKINDINILSSFANLKKLDCSSNNIKSVLPLANLKELTHLKCTNNKISFLVPFNNKIIELDLRNNQIPESEIEIFNKISNYKIRK